MNKKKTNVLDNKTKQLLNLSEIYNTLLEYDNELNLSPYNLKDLANIVKRYMEDLCFYDDYLKIYQDYFNDINGTNVKKEIKILN